MGFIVSFIHYFMWLLGLMYLEIIISLDIFSVELPHDKLSDTVCHKVSLHCLSSSIFSCLHPALNHHLLHITHFACVFRVFCCLVPVGVL